MSNLSDVLAVILLMFAVWFATDPEGMGEAFAKSVNAFDSGLSNAD